MNLPVFVSVAAHWLHLFAAVAWIGGLFFYLIILLPSFKNLDPVQATRLAQIVAMRFRAVAVGSLGALLLTGLFLFNQILQGVTNRAAFFGSPYGRVLAVKVALAVVAIGAGAGLGFVTAPRLVAAIEAHDEPRLRALGKTMGVLTGATFLLGLAITVCVAWLHVSA
ncbi:MAG: CopD family protein [bacterium]